MITSRDAESTCFKGSRTSCDVIIFRIFWPNFSRKRSQSTCFKGSRTSCDVIIFRIFWPNFSRKRSHHVMDASCRPDHFWDDLGDVAPLRPRLAYQLSTLCGPFEARAIRNESIRANPPSSPPPFPPFFDSQKLRFRYTSDLGTL